MVMTFAMDNKSLVKALIAVYGDKQDMLAKELGVSQPTISRWLAGGTLAGENRDRVLELAEEKGLINQGEQTSSKASRAKPELDPKSLIPEIQLTAGLGGGGYSLIENKAKNGVTFATEVVRDHWRLPNWILNRMNAKPDHVAAFPVQGDSMEPTLHDGDVIFIDTKHRVPSPPGIYALADEFGGIVVKRIEVTSRPGDEDVTILIASDNPRHNPRTLTLAEISIVGRYLGRFTV